GELFSQKGLVNRFLQNRLTRLVLNKVGKIVVLNDETVLYLSKHQSRLLKLPCGTDVQYFQRSESFEESTKIRIGFPGDKKRNEKNFTLFTKIVEQLSLTNDIEIVEFHNMSRKQVLQNLNTIDLLLMTSTVEGSPQIIKEAMACNTPIVSTSVGDVDDLLKGVVNCFVIDSFETSSFITPVQMIIDLPRAKRVSNGRKKLVEMELDSESVAKKLQSLYQETV
ncbi:MAG: glycosyltransferase family 1 protein, partial [Flavobacterium sp.]